MHFYFYIIFFTFLLQVKPNQNLPSFQFEQQSSTAHLKPEKKNNQHESKMNKLKQDFGQRKIFLQQNQRYALTPALLFRTQSSFKVNYELQIVQKEVEMKEKQSEEQSKISEASQKKQKYNDVYEVHPALQKINFYNLKEVEGMDVNSCSLMELFFTQNDVPYIICLTNQKIVQVYRVEETRINLEFSFMVSCGQSRMRIVSPSQIVFYNESQIEYYSYQKQSKIVSVASLRLENDFSVEQCKSYTQYNPFLTKTPGATQQVEQQQHVRLICFTNNNMIAKNKTRISFQILEEIKKDYVMVFLLEENRIQELNHFQLAQRNNSTLNHIIGFDIIDSLENVIMISYNIYKIDEDKTELQQDQELPKSNKINRSAFHAVFVSSYCSIYKIYIQTSQMVLINRMLLQSSPYPLLETSLQINVMLAVATQTTITFYHLDVLKEMFSFIQKISIPSNSSFNCYEFSQLRNSFQSLSLTCAKDQEDTKTVSFVMIFDEEKEKYVPVGDIIVGKQFFHLNQFIYTLDKESLSVIQANQQYVVIQYAPEQTVIRIYEVHTQRPQDKNNSITLIVIPAEAGRVYVNLPLPFIEEMDYDMEYDLNLKGTFQGSNISFVRVDVFNQNGNPEKTQEFLKQDRIYSYEYFLLISVYIREDCIRVIKIQDTSFYRILRIQKSRVDPDQSEEDDYYYYTQTCSKIKNSYVCELSEIHLRPEFLNSPKANPFLIESTKTTKLLDVQYFSDSNTFLYLYEISLQSSNGIGQKNYGLMFVDMIDQSDASQCYDLHSFVQKIISHSFDKKFVVCQMRLKKKLLEAELIISTKRTKIFCLLNSIKSFFSGSQIINFGKSCVIVQMNEQNPVKSFVQQDKLIIVETLKDINKINRTNRISVFNFLNNQMIVKQGVYHITSSLQKDKYQEREENEYYGLYKQYLIVVNETTISKYYLGVESVHLYDFVFNPQFLETNSQPAQNSTRRTDEQSSKFDSRRKQGDSLPVKYVQFLEKYLIVQFQSFYQLYSIGEELISIQISANNFNAYPKYQNFKDKAKSPPDSLGNVEGLSNVIINDAFLIEGDNIVIYQKDHLVVAKYITNPSLQLGPFDQSHLIVKKDLSIRLTPVTDFFGQNLDNEVHQEIMLRIFYSHYLVEKIAKNIKLLTVPSQTENFQLEIWTNVFRGPVLQYYLSDTFNDSIILKQHIIANSPKTTQNSPKTAHNLDQVEFIIVEFHRPFATRYMLKKNASHLQVNTSSGELYIELMQCLQEQIFMRFLLLQLPNGQGEVICILTSNHLVFIRSSQGQERRKLEIMEVMQHNITGLETPNNVSGMEVMQTNNARGEEDDEFCFVLALMVSEQITSKQQNPRFLHLLEFGYDMNHRITFKKREKLITGDQILQIRSLQFINSHQNQLILLTELQSLVLYQLSDTETAPMLKIKQRIRLDNIIPDKYRSNIEKYVRFELFFSNNLHDSLRDSPDERHLPSDKITLLIFASDDKSLHVEFQVSVQSSENESLLSFSLKNIYAGYANLQFLKVVSVGFWSQDEVQKLQNDSTFSTIPYKYFVLLYEYETSDDLYLIYYGYNYNFSQNKQVGYFKCGQKITIQNPQHQLIQNLQAHRISNPQNQVIQNSGNQLIQNPKNPSLQERIPTFRDPDDNKILISSINSNGQIQAQGFYISLQRDAQNQSRVFPRVELSYQNVFQINTSVYMYLNYKKPPVVSYILLNARNFNVRAGIYTKFNIIQDQITWIAFFIGAPVLVLLCFVCLFLLKKHQPKETLMRRSKPSKDFLLSGESRLSNQREERVIQIGSTEEENNTNQNQAIGLEESILSAGEYVRLYRSSKNKQNSLLESPFRSDYEQAFLEEISESDISESEEIKVEAIGHAEREQMEIFKLLIDKRKINKKRESFG